MTFSTPLGMRRISQIKCEKSYCERPFGAVFSCCHQGGSNSRVSRSIGFQRTIYIRVSRTVIPLQHIAAPYAYTCIVLLSLDSFGGLSVARGGCTGEAIYAGHIEGQVPANPGIGVYA